MLTAHSPGTRKRARVREGSDQRTSACAIGIPEYTPAGHVLQLQCRPFGLPSLLLGCKISKNVLGGAIDGYLPKLWVKNEVRLGLFELQGHMQSKGCLRTALVHAQMPVHKPHFDPM